MANLAVIPARGGSKRIPKKNIKDFLGKPIIAYSIESALKSDLFDKVIVSTDDQEIAEIAKHYGAEVPFLRSEVNSNDFATTADVIKEVINSFEKESIFFDNICCIYPCAPFVTDEKLILSFEKMVNQGFDSVFPVIKFSFPIQRALVVDNDRVRFFNEEYALARSQDLQDFYHDVGQFYWLKTDSFKKNQKIITEKSGALIILESEAQDIDNVEDWLIAEMKFKIWKKETF